MTVPGAAQPSNKFPPLILRGLLYLLPLLLISQLIGQPEIDDPYPVKGARVIGAKIFKLQNHTRSGLDDLIPSALAVGSSIFTAWFYLCFIILPRPYEVIRSLLVGQHSSRAPPPHAVV